jgi:serine/threonine protein kinase
MLSALEHIHEEGFSHRDIKLENMLFDQAYNLKIADFGYATYTQKELTTK